ncbi:cell surface glycoprotein PsA precursor [Heterostelium album PN500]|uniref:Cell surface glycoprotein PsA n=1 Tax=Heterostelium pallidum (strain ATCC 26659 / Pp 5 / PN500) TaxID=670386 RepID=D3B8M4_HETP5|nr:cell surface glycoprotein PsA precursor [Heterostelium album PN500]EFA82392.1 cell surface glycoprotein PsA precursor [Heterostelium album PN500]|eukprot:XP_020434509.1 cell surface glycoprotein PsA precursor [Heterostelium album PN500]
MKFLILLVVLLTITGRTQAALTAAEKTLILNTFNGWRDNALPIPTTHLSTLTWNTAYETNLQKYVNTCATSFSPFSKTAKVAEFVITFSGTWNLKVILDYIGGTAANYNFHTKSCASGKSCLHEYTVVAKGKTAACAVNRCGSTYRFYCDFDPVGPYRGVNPYPTPTPNPTPTPTQTQTIKPTPTPTQTQTTKPTPTPTQTQTTSPKSKTINWQSKSTPVRDQGQCGSCYIFAAFANSEARYVIKTGANPETVDFSEQEGLNCISGGCNGGWPTTVYNTFKTTGYGPESANKYTGVQTTCTQTATPRVSFTGFTQTAKNKDALIAALQTGPIAISLLADDGFQSYSSGIYNCPTKYTSVNHAVTLTGYDEATDSWLIKNSWNTWWGIDGYIKLTAANDNCNILGYASSYINY